MNAIDEQIAAAKRDFNEAQDRYINSTDPAARAQALRDCDNHQRTLLDLHDKADR